MPSITNLEKSVKTLAAKLEKDGFTCEVEIFKTGKNGAEHFGPSKVSLEVTKGDDWEEITFIADDYYGAGRKAIGGKTFKEMKVKAFELLSRTFPELNN